MVIFHAFPDEIPDSAPPRMSLRSQTNLLFTGTFHWFLCRENGPIGYLETANHMTYVNMTTKMSFGLGAIEDAVGLGCPFPEL